MLLFNSSFLLLLTAALTAAISTAEVNYSVKFIQKMRRTTVAAAPTAAATAATAAATAAAAVVSLRLYDYFPSQCNYKPQPRRSGRHELMVLLLSKFSMFILP
jgi:hypothetical protein